MAVVHFLAKTFRRNRIIIRMLFTVGLGILLFLRLRQGSRNDHRAGHEHEILSSAVEPTGAPRRPFHSLVRRKDLAPIAETYAYASLLCDDVMLDATKVLIHSFRKTGSPYPFLLLVLPQVSQREELERLGAQVHVISELDYPFKVTAEKTAINKMCRYSKLHIWKFVQYRKIIFIDVDCLIIQVNQHERSLSPLFPFRTLTRPSNGPNSQQSEMQVTLSIPAFLFWNPHYAHMQTCCKFT